MPDEGIGSVTYANRHILQSGLSGHRPGLRQRGIRPLATADLPVIQRKSGRLDDGSSGLPTAVILGIQTVKFLEWATKGHFGASWKLDGSAIWPDVMEIHDAPPIFTGW